MKSLSFWIAWLALGAAQNSLAGGTALRAGIAVVEITPPAGEELVGYQVQRQAQSVHDPLFAKALVLRTEETSLAFVSSDLYRFQSPALIDRIRRELGIEHTILSSSRNHSGPSLDAESRKRSWGLDLTQF